MSGEVELLGFFRNYADGVDRFPAEPDPGFLIERYVADEEFQRYFAGEAAEQPDDPDFHFLGAGYRHIAELCYPALQEAGILP